MPGGEGRAGEGRAGEGRAGEGRAGEGRAGEGRAGEGSLDAVFFALADPTRRAVVRRLLSRDAVTATELAVELPMTRQAVSKHLAALVGAGLVEGSRRGRETRYRLTPEPLEEASSWLGVIGAEWDARLNRLSRHIEGRPAGGGGVGRPG